ncbi:[LysW]-lysine hydrolase [Candidatus Woesearchaeota archaeon]|nr:[LysW]-lysine hydrolase [Candidatus Woesearchaeota archaeon]
MTELIRQMVEIYSPSGKEEKLADFLVKETEKLGFKAYKDEVGNFICEKGDGKTIMLVGHIDTVPGEIKVRVEGNRLYGRGSVDAKSCIATFINAASKAKTDKRIIVVGAVDEEKDSKGAKNLLKKYNPECIIIGEPSGWNCVTLGYKGIALVEFFMQKEMEHNARRVPSSKEEAVFFYHKLAEYCKKYNEGKSIFHTLDPAILEIKTNDEAFSESCRLKVSFRTPPNYSVEELKGFIDGIKNGAEITFRVHDTPVEQKKNNFLVRSFLKNIRKNNGQPKFKLKTGTSDMNILQEYKVPIVAYGPGDSTLDHTPNEHLELAEYEKAISVLTDVLEGL